jgi:hypothetical protein
MKESTLIMWFSVFKFTIPIRSRKLAMKDAKAEDYVSVLGQKVGKAVTIPTIHKLSTTAFYAI